MFITDIVDLLSDEQRNNNRNTHRWNDDGRCDICDTKTWHDWASLPCGYEVPAHVQPWARPAR